jgi:hypothetical protein
MGVATSNGVIDPEFAFCDGRAAETVVEYQSLAGSAINTSFGSNRSQASKVSLRRQRSPTHRSTSDVLEDINNKLDQLARKFEVIKKDIVNNRSPQPLPK